MADFSGGADFRLIVGANVSLSYNQMQKDISSLVSRLNSNPPKIKVGLDLDNATIANFRTQVAEISKSLGGLGYITSTSATASSASTAAASMADLAAKTRDAASASTAKTSAIKADNTEEIKRQSLLKKSYTLLTQMQNAENKWTASKSGTTSTSYTAIQSDIALLKQWTLQFKIGQITAGQFQQKLSSLSSSFTTNSNTIKAAGEATQTWGSRLGALSAKFGTWFSITRVIMAAYRAVRQMVTNVIELDTAMTELKKVTDETDDTYDKFLTKATSRAKELGAALSDTVRATADFARLGYGIEDAEKLSDAAIVYKNVGDGISDIETASESIIATMQAFNIPAEQAMSIVDRFNEVGNNFAISSKGVGDALLRSGAALQSANNTLDESIALAAAANTIVQDPEKVGTTLKTVSMYLRAAKTDAEELGESTEGMAHSVSELRDELLALTGNKVDILEDDGKTFKSTYKIIEELSNVWDGISDISQANILELIGGKRNSNVVSALLENFETASKALETSAQSAGSALTENEKVLDSIQGKLNIMKASFETLSQTLIDSDFVKMIVDFITILLNSVNYVAKVIDALGGLKTVLYTIFAIFVTKNISSVISGFTKIGTAITGLTSIFTKLKTVMSAYVAATAATKNASSGALIVYGQSTSVLGRLSAALKAAGVSASTFQLALGAFFVLLPVAIGLVDHFTTTLKELQEQLNEDKVEYNNLVSEISSVNSELETTQKRIAELERKDKLSFTEQDEYNNLIKTNNELKRRNDLLEAEASIKRKEANTSFVDTIQTDVSSNDYFVDYKDGKIKKGSGGNLNGSATELEYIEQQFEERKKLYQELMRTSSKEESDTIQQQIDSIDQYFTERSATLNEYAQDIEYIQEPTNDDDRAVNKWLDYINDFQDKMAIAIGGDDAKTNAFNRLVDNWKFDEALNPLQELGKEGKVTLDTLKEKMSDPVFAEFVNKLAEIGFISNTTDGSLRYLASAFNGTTTSAKKYLSSLNNENINEFINNLDEESEALGITESELAKLTAAHLLFNDTKVSTDNKQSAFINLAAAIGKTSEEITYLIKLLNAASDGTMLGLSDTMEPFSQVGGYRKNTLLGDIQVDPLKILKERYGIGREILIPEKNEDNTYRPRDNTSSKTNTLDYEDPTDAIINRINLHSKELEQQEESIQNAIEIAELENDYKKQISLTNDLINARKKRIEELNAANAGIHNEAEYLRNSNPWWDEESWFNSQGEATEDYYKTFNSAKTKAEQDEIKKLFDSLSKYKKAYMNNAKEITDVNEQILQDEENILELRWDNSNNWIDERNKKGDWSLYADSEYAAWQRVVKWLREEYPDELDKIREAEQKAIDANFKHSADWIDERNTYNDWELYGDNEVSAWERVLERFQTEFPDELGKIKEIEQKIFEARKEAMEKSISDIEDYIDARNHYNDWDSYGDSELKAIQRQTEIIEDSYKRRLLSSEEYTKKLEEQRQRIYTLAQDEINKSLDNIDRYIDARNHYNDWNAYGEKEIDAIKRKTEVIEDAYEKDLLSKEEYVEKLEEYSKQIYSLAQDEINNALSNIDKYIDARKHYDDWNAYGEKEIDAIKRKTEVIEDAYEKDLLSKEEYVEKLEEYSKQIYSLAQDEINNALSNIDKYIDARKHYDDWDAYDDSEIEAIKRKCQVLTDAYEQGLISLETYTDKSEEYAQRLYSIGKEYIDKSLSDIDKYITARNTYNDWTNWGDSEIEAIKRQIDVLDEAYKAKLLSLEEYTNRVDEYNQKLYSVAKSDVIETISELIEDYEKLTQEKKDSISHESNQYNSLKTLLQSYYDVTNAITQAHHEINKELKASQSMYEYLNEETRKLLFNQEDYNTLNTTLLDIQSTANELQEQYNKDILNATEETIAEITSQYQMQYETMMKQYEIAKAELDIAKKRQKLDNVLAERNVRMFINGQWQWVADTQKVIDAQNELAEAEIEREQRETSLKQIDSINKLTSAQDDITTQINYLESDLEKIRDKWSEMQKMLNGESHEVAEALKQISQVSSPELQKVIEETGGNITSFSESLSESINTMSTTINFNLNNATLDILNTVVKNVDDITSVVAESVNEIHENISDGLNNINKTITDDLGEYSEAIDEYSKTIKDFADDIVNIELDDFADAIDSLVKKINNVNIGGTGSQGGSSSSKGSSSGSSSSSSQGSNATATIPGVGTVGVHIDSNGKTTTTGLPVGTIVHTSNGDYKITGGTGGNYKVNAEGSRYTSGGLNLIGEEGFEAFITNQGRLIPINQPTLGNIGAGGIIFNRAQMENLRSLWDLSNMVSTIPHISSLVDNRQNATTDNSIHINGLVVGEQGNENWINGLRRYVATHR